MDTSLLASETVSSTDSPAMPAPTPFDLEIITITRREHVELKSTAAHYKRMHGDATKRLERLRAHHQKEITEWQEKHKALQAMHDLALSQLRGLPEFDS